MIHPLWRLLLVLFGVFFGMLIILTRNWDAFWVSSAKISLIESISFTPNVLRTFFFFLAYYVLPSYLAFSPAFEIEKSADIVQIIGSLDWTPFLSLSWCLQYHSLVAGTAVHFLQWQSCLLVPGGSNLRGR